MLGAHGLGVLHVALESCIDLERVPVTQETVAAESEGYSWRSFERMQHLELQPMEAAFCTHWLRAKPQKDEMRELCSKITRLQST